MRALGWLSAAFGAFLLLVFGMALAAQQFGVISEMWTEAQVAGGLGVAFVALWLFLDWGTLGKLGRDQTVQRSAMASVAALLGLGIFVAVNVVGHKFDKRWDLTESQRFTLSQQSKDIARGLDREVTVQAFFPRGSNEDREFRELMSAYQESSTLLKVSYHDPYGDPVAAETAKITSTFGTVIFKLDKNEQRVESKFDESAVTNALIKLTSEKSHPVCIVKGHGELGSDDESTPDGMGGAVNKLEGQNYTASEIALLEQAPTPASCQVVVLASPRNELLPAELDRLAAYVAGGGNLVVALDPLSVPGVAADMQRYGIAVGNDIVIEADPYRQVTAGDPSFVVLDASSFTGHEITSKLEGGVLFRLVRSVAPGTAVAGLTVKELAHTTDMGWGESTPEVQPMQRDPEDKQGPVGVAAVAEVDDPSGLRTKTESAPGGDVVPVLAAPSAADEIARAKGGKVVVFGDADFIGNVLFLQGVNQDLFMNTVAWMVGEVDQVSVRANEAGKGKITVDVVQGFLVVLIAMVGIPGLTVLGAVGTWLRRRKL
jgi:ABC-type uncharacterized transport system involved in gliding motility auxiliary subunit